MKIKTSELQGKALDWAVAKCEGFFNGNPPICFTVGSDDSFWEVSKNWAQGGPIIEREGIRLRPDHGWSAAVYWPDGRSEWYEGPTILIAAMRCYVASKLGKEVDIPEELLK